MNRHGRAVPKVNMGQILAIPMWLFGWLNTIIFVYGLKIRLWITAESGFLAWAGYIILLAIIGLCLQAIFTYLEGPIWEWRLTNISAYIGLGFDVFTNMAGAWQIIKGTMGSGSVDAVKDMFGTVTNGAAQAAAEGGIETGLTRLFWVILLSIIIAALPEILWKREKRLAMKWYAP